MGIPRQGVTKRDTHAMLGCITISVMPAGQPMPMQASGHRHIEQATGQDDAGLPGLANGKVQARVRG